VGIRGVIDEEGDVEGTEVGVLEQGSQSCATAAARQSSDD
jgi:hypothetical protein